MSQTFLNEKTHINVTFYKIRKKGQIKHLYTL